MADWPTLLIVEDEPNLIRLLSEYFTGQGYRVRAHEWGQEALAACRADPPSLALLDIHLPDLTGYELAEQLRAHWRTRDVPVIFLTSRRARQDRLHGLELGAVDYIAKPFDLQELNLRVQNALRRHVAAGQAPYDPVTGLPEGVLVDEALAGLRNREDWAAVVVRLRNLGPFQESYGFAAAADVRRAVGLKLRQAAEAHAGAEDLGQLEPDCFCVLTTADRAERLVRDLRAALGPSLDYFYPVEDRPDTLAETQRLSVQVNILAAGPAAAAEPAALKRRLLAACP